MAELRPGTSSRAPCRLPPIAVTGVSLDPGAAQTHRGLTRSSSAAAGLGTARKDHSPARRPAAALQRAGDASPARHRSGGGTGRLRSSADAEEEARKAQERIQAWRREQASKARQDAAAQQAQRQCAAARRSTAALLKERQRAEVYALNALLRMNEEAKTAAFVAAKRAEAQRREQQPGQHASAACAPEATSSAGLGSSSGTGAAASAGGSAGHPRATCQQASGDSRLAAGAAPAAMYHGV